MIRTKDEEKWQGRISYLGKEEDIDDPAEVEKKIREGRECLECVLRSSKRVYTTYVLYLIVFVAQDEMAGPGVGISNELISLQIISANVPDLTLIDLPGIARVAVKGQPENIGDQVNFLYLLCFSYDILLKIPL